MITKRPFCEGGRISEMLSTTAKLWVSIPPKPSLRPWQAIIAFRTCRQICMDRGALPCGLILGTLIAIAKLTFESPPRHLRAVKLAEDGWDVELIRKDQPIAHLNPFELRATLRQRVQPNSRLLFVFVFVRPFKARTGRPGSKQRQAWQSHACNAAFRQAIQGGCGHHRL